MHISYGASGLCAAGTRPRHPGHGLPLAEWLPSWGGGAERSQPLQKANETQTPVPGSGRKGCVLGAGCQRPPAGASKARPRECASDQTNHRRKEVPGGQAFQLPGGSILPGSGHAQHMTGGLPVGPAGTPCPPCAVPCSWPESRSLVHRLQPLAKHTAFPWTSQEIRSP